MGDTIAIELGAMGLIVLTLTLVAYTSYRTYAKLVAPKRERRWCNASYITLVFAVALLTFIHVILPKEADVLMNGLAAQLRPLSPPDPASEALHKTLFIADMHADSLMWPHRNLLARHTYGHVDLPRLREGNVALQCFTIVTGSPIGLNFESNAAPSILTDSITTKVILDGWNLESITSRAARTLYQTQLLHQYAKDSDGALTIIRTKQDLQALVEAREKNGSLIGAILGIEGLHALDDEFANVDVFFKAGVRMMAAVHFFDNALGGSAAGTYKIGLTNFGIKVMKEMEKRGIAIDVAHASPATIDDTLKIASRPVLVSHTGVRGVCNNSRNLNDDHIRGIAKTGGVIGIAYFRPAICGGEGRQPGDDVASIVQSILYVRNLVGVRHVALGSDFDGTVRTPFDTTGLVHLTDALVRGGLSPEEIALVMGGNVRRVFMELLPNP